MVYHIYPKILAVIKLGNLPEIWPNALLAEFKFGSLLGYVIAQISLYAMLTNINMVVLSASAKSPNLNHRQYFWIYGML